MRYKDPIAGDKGSVCHCNSDRYNNNPDIFVIRTKNLGTEAVVITRIHCLPRLPLVETRGVLTVLLPAAQLPSFMHRKS